MIRSDENSNLISNLLKARIYGLKAIIEDDAGNTSSAYAYIDSSEVFARNAAVTRTQDIKPEEMLLWSAVLETLQFFTDEISFTNSSKAKKHSRLYKSIQNYSSK